jgi:hypothetical protein
MFFERIARHLEHVAEFGRHLTPDEAVDEVLLRAHREFDAEWDDGRLRTPARIETDIPDAPPSEWVTTLGEERLEFYEWRRAVLLRYVEGLHGARLARTLGKTPSGNGPEPGG